jgi:tetratricopeptide (TPR) repeat protein
MAPTESEPRFVVTPGPEAQAGAAFMEGRLLELEGRLLEAAEAYQRAAQLDPESAELQQTLAHLYMRANLPDLALEHAERAFELDPDDERSRRILAGLYVALKRYHEAADLMEPAFESKSLSVDGLLVLFNLYLEIQRPQDALRVADQIEERDQTSVGAPPSVRAILTRGKAYEALDEWEEAETVYRRGLEAWPNETALYDAVAHVLRRREDREGELQLLHQKLLVLPGDPRTLLRIGHIHESSGDREGAIAALRELSRAHPDHLNARLQLGFFYYQADELDAAILEFQFVAERSPLGLVHHQAGQDDPAMEALRAVPPEAERYADSRALLARILEQDERFDEALVEAKRAVAASPDDAPLQVYLAGLLLRSGDRDAAVGTMVSLIEKDPQDPDLKYDLGVLYDEAGDQEQALEWMEKTLEKDPDHASALNYIGYTWAVQGVRLDEAEEPVRRALQVKPGDGYITDSLGWVFYKRGLKRLADGETEAARADFKAAVEELERAVQLTDPADPVITRHLADAYRSVSRLDEALATYRKALELDPEEEDEVDIQLQIELLEMELGEETVGKSAPH